MFELVVKAAGDAAGTADPNAAAPVNTLPMTIIWIVVMIAIFYFLMIRPQKKREKQMRMMLNDMRPGDEIITIGGIMGKIVSIKDESVLIESGADRTKLRFEKSAIKQVLTEHDEDEDDE